MICPKCGTSIADDAAFCQKCGAKLISVDLSKKTSFITTAKSLPKSVVVGLVCFILGIVVMIAGVALPNIIDMDGYQGVSFSSPYLIGSFVLWISGSVFMILVSKPQKEVTKFHSCVSIHCSSLCLHNNDW